MSPLPLQLYQPRTVSLAPPANHHLNRRYYYSSNDTSSSAGLIAGILFGIIIPAFIIAAIVAAIASRHRKEQKKRMELEQIIHRQIHLHPNVCSNAPGNMVMTTAGIGTQMSANFNKVDGTWTRSENPGPVSQQIVNDVSRELGQVQPAALRGGDNRIETVEDHPTKDSLPAYQPR